MHGGHLVQRVTRTLSPHPGFGIPTITATRILKGQEQGKLGPETPLALDAFPYVALSKVNHRHAGHGARVMPGMGTQGCPWGCWHRSTPGMHIWSAQDPCPSHICSRVKK